MKKCIWLCQLPQKKGQWDNDYRFFTDGTIEHEYDLSVNKYNLVSNIRPAEISESDRTAILKRIDECPQEWQAFVKELFQQ